MSKLTEDRIERLIAEARDREANPTRIPLEKLDWFEHRHGEIVGRTNLPKGR